MFITIIKAALAALILAQPTIPALAEPCESGYCCGDSWINDSGVNNGSDCKSGTKANCGGTYVPCPANSCYAGYENCQWGWWGDECCVGAAG